MTPSGPELRAHEGEPADDDGAFARALMAGLAGHPRRLPCKFFYDEVGSVLFDRICELPEYYPTRTELAILADHAPAMAARIGADAEIVEFGAGSGKKIRLLLDALDRPVAYLPIDISGPHLLAASADLAKRYPALRIEPIVADYTRPFGLPPMKPNARRRAGFFPGSTIGNFAPADAARFLRQTRSVLAGGGLLIGVDLVKDPAVLHAAYNDAAGVTASFNRNILVRANAELGADFRPERFAHYAHYNPVAQRIEMHLVSLERQSVSLLGRSFEFSEGETVHTEDSYKHTVTGFEALCVSAGFRADSVWRDSNGYFAVFWLEAAA